MTIEEAIESVKLKFTSGNNIEVKRAMITNEEWEIIDNNLKQREREKEKK